MFQGDVSANHLCPYSVRNHTYEVLIIPQFPTPQPFSQLRMEQPPNRGALEDLSHRVGAALFLNQLKQVRLVRYHLKRSNLQLVAFYTILRGPLRSFGYATLKKQSAVVENSARLLLKITGRISVALRGTYLEYSKKIGCLWWIFTFLSPASCGVSGGGLR